MEVADVDAVLGQAGRAAGLKDVDWLVGVGFGHPLAHWAAAQPLVLKVAEQGQVVIGADLLARVEVELLRVGEPKRAAGLRAEVPLDDGADVSVEVVAGCGDFVW